MDFQALILVNASKQQQIKFDPRTENDYYQQMGRKPWLLRSFAAVSAWTKTSWPDLINSIRQRLNRHVKQEASAK